MFLPKVLRVSFDLSIAEFSKGKFQSFKCIHILDCIINLLIPLIEHGELIYATEIFLYSENSTEQIEAN